MSLNLKSLVCIFLAPWDEGGRRQEVFLLLLKNEGYLKDELLAIPGAINWTCHYFLEISLLLGRRTLDKLAVQTWVFGRYIMDINEVSPSHQGRWLAIFVTNDKMWALKQKLEFWNTCICCPDFDSLSSERLVMVLIIVGGFLFVWFHGLMK